MNYQTTTKQKWKYKTEKGGLVKKPNEENKIQKK